MRENFFSGSSKMHSTSAEDRFGSQEKVNMFSSILQFPAGKVDILREWFSFRNVLRRKWIKLQYQRLAAVFRQLRRLPACFIVRSCLEDEIPWAAEKTVLAEKLFSCTSDFWISSGQNVFYPNRQQYFWLNSVRHSLNFFIGTFSLPYLIFFVLFAHLKVFECTCCWASLPRTP